MQVFPFSFVLALFAAVAAAGDLPEGNACIRGNAGGSEIVITTTSRVAGAIHSLTWSGREFIDSQDHGRQLQSASNLDAGSALSNETFNPTEAGSMRDGAGERSSSRLLFLRTAPGELQTLSQMAFWLAPGEKSGANFAKNQTVLSDHLLTKRVHIGYRDLPHVISYDATFSLPIGESHTQVTFEALTGYMPAEFERFQQFNAHSGELEALSDGPGETPSPVVFSLPSGSHAMAIYAPPPAAGNAVGPTYGRFRFPAQKVVKWNCVFRVHEPAGLKPGEYAWRMFVVVGDLETVRSSLRALHREFAKPPTIPVPQ